jgi:hypothetical protein
MNRKQKRAAARKLKKEQGKIRKINEAVSSMPTRCDECGVSFNGTEAKHLDTWKIAVYDDGPINLVCPDCVPDDIKKQKHISR